MAVNKDLIEEISQVVIGMRKMAGLTQKKLAHFAGVGKTVVFDVENKKKSVRLCTLLKIFEVLNISITLQSPLQSRKNKTPFAQESLK